MSLSLVQEYRAYFPAQLPSRTACSFMGRFAVEVILSAAAGAPLLSPVLFRAAAGGAISALCCVVTAVAHPIFRIQYGRWVDSSVRLGADAPSQGGSPPPLGSSDSWLARKWRNLREEMDDFSQLVPYAAFYVGGYFIGDQLIFSPLVKMAFGISFGTSGVLSFCGIFLLRWSVTKALSYYPSTGTFDKPSLAGNAQIYV